MLFLYLGFWALILGSNNQTNKKVDFAKNLLHL